MDNYLDSLNSEGTRQDNDLEFTIDPLKQAERYATFQHENSVYCLLRIIQGLTLAGAESLDIKVEKRRIRLQAKCRSTDIQPGNLYEALHRSDRTRLLDHICTGIFSATHESVASLEIGLGGEKLVIEERNFRLEESASSTAHFQVVLTHSSRGWMETGAKDQLELAGRLHHAPMPVLIDSQRVAMNEPAPQKERWYKDLTRPQLLARIQEHVPSGWNLRPLQDGLYLYENEAGSQIFTILSPAGALFLDLDFTSDQKLVPIIDGVTGTPIETKRFPGLHGCHHARGARTDLSGLTLSDNEPFLDEVRQRYRSTLQAILPHLSCLQAVWPKNFDLGGAVGTAAFAGDLALITVPVTLLFGGMYQAYDKLSFRVQQNKAQQRLVEETEARVKALLESLS